MEDTLAAPGSPVEPLANSQKAFAGCKESHAKIGASVIDILANLKIRSDSVKRMTQIQNTS
jgi:hypothetical protein